VDLEAGVLSHVSEDNCLQCNMIDPTKKWGRLYWCKLLKYHVRTNPLCLAGWRIISEKMKPIEAVSQLQRTEALPLASGKAGAIVPQVCDRLQCRVASCYGWDLCRQARDEATKEEWDKLLKELYEKKEAEG
jgi:hypothetical protein